MVGEIGVRRLGPERQAEMRHAPVHLAIRIGPVGAVHGAPFGLVDLVLGRAVGDGVARRVSFLEILGLDRTGMQEAEMRSVDIPLEALQPVAFTHQEADVQILFGNEQRFQHRHRRGDHARAHVNPDQSGALLHPIGLGADLLLEILRRRHVRHFQTLAVDVEFPAVIDAADAVLLVAAEEQRGTAVRALMVEHADPAGTVAKRDQGFAKQHQPHRIAVYLQFGGSGGGNPVLPHHFAHDGAGADPRQIMAIARSGHPGPPVLVLCRFLGQSALWRDGRLFNCIMQLIRKAVNIATVAQAAVYLERCGCCHYRSADSGRRHV
jgi:hypothetical protein